jgi:hypothetical protein
MLPVGQVFDTAVLITPADSRQDAARAVAGSVRRSVILEEGKNMRATLFCAALAFAGAAAIGFSSDKGPANNTRAPEVRGEHGGHEVAEQALRNYYGPTAKAHITSEFEVDGVHVFNASVDRDGARAEATLTAKGDYITMGVPEAMNTITPAAADTAQLFKTPPTSIIREDIHAFYVTVKGPENRPSTFEFDATGRVRDVKTSEELRADANAPRANAAQSRRMTDVTMQRFSGIQVEGVLIALHNPGYFNVPFHNQHGRGWAIINEQNDVAEWRYPEPIDKLPEPVRRAIDHDLRGDRILNIEQGASRLYRITQNVNGEDLVMLVNSAGGIDWISSRELHRASLRQFQPR